jgi:ATP-dependent RNA helicase RhlE
MHSFKELPLIEPLHRAIADEGYTVPTPIQAQSIIPLLEGRDILGCAQTGTGKTAAFVLPILQKLATQKKGKLRGTPRALILAPTRELAAQIGKSIQVYGKYVPITSAVIFGGVGHQLQIQAMNRGVDILVATPGRLLDLMNQGYVYLQEVEIFVLDEADRMLDMGFIHDIHKIITKLPHTRQSMFFSATLEPKVVELARKLIRDPIHVTVNPEKPTVERIEQCVYFVDKERKDALLIQLLKGPSFKRVIVFTQMKHVANRVAEVLFRAGIRAEVIHGNKSQGARTASLEAFRHGRSKVLVATDIAARGIDIEGVTQVINYELPHEPETYVHRIGRTARAGEEGQAISFCSAFERSYFEAIEDFIHKEIPVIQDKLFHSNAAMNATGAAARPPPKGKQGGKYGRGFGPRFFGRKRVDGRRGHNRR